MAREQFVDRETSASNDGHSCDFGHDDDEREAALGLWRFAKLLLVSPPFRHLLSTTATLFLETFVPHAEPLMLSALVDSAPDAMPAQQSQPSVVHHAKCSSYHSILETEVQSARPCICLRRWKSLINEYAASRRYTAALAGIRSAAGNRAKAGRSASKCQGLYAAAQEDIHQLVHEFIGGNFPDVFFGVLDRFSTVLGDYEIATFLERVSDYVRATRTAGFREGQLAVLLKTGQASFHRRQLETCREIEKEFRELLHELCRNDSPDRFGRALECLVGDVFLDGAGNFVSQLESYDDLQSVFIRIMRELFSEIPVVSVEEHDDNMDLYIDNIVLDGSQLLPDRFTIEAVPENFSEHAAEPASLRRTEIRITSQGSHADVRSMFFRYNHRSFPKFTDSGTADATIMAKGVSFTIVLKFLSDAEGVIQDFEGNNSNSSRTVSPKLGRKRPITFYVKRVDVTVDKLKLDVHDVDHEILCNILMPLVTSRAARQMERSVKSHLEHFLHEFDKRATAARRASAHVAAFVRKSAVLRQLDCKL